MNNKETTKTVKIAYWNASGIKNKKHELLFFLQENNIDVMLIGETWLKPKDHFQMVNYTIYRTDRTHTTKGGTAICVRNILPHIKLTTNTTKIESTAIKIIVNKKFYTIVSAYCPPKTNFNNEEIDQLLGLHDYVIVMGDLNAKHTLWGCRTTNATGRTLLQYLDTHDVLLHAPTTPTHYGTVGAPDILDVAITKGINQEIEITAPPLLSSDHNPIITEITGCTKNKGELEIQKNSWTKYSAYLRDNTTDIKTINRIEDIDQEVQTFTDEITSAVNSSSKKYRVTKEKPYLLPQDLLTKIKEKRKARKLAQRTLNPDHQIRATRLNNEVRKLLLDYHTEMWELKMHRCGKSTKDIFRTIRSWKNQGQSIPPLHCLNGVAYTCEEKAEGIANTLEKQFTANDVDSDSDSDSSVDSSIQDLDEPDTEERRLDEIPLQPATFQEVSNVIKNLNNRKAPGKDRVPNLALKLLTTKMKTKLVNIINGCLRLNYFPKGWRHAIVCTFLKPNKNPTWPDSYRPISLLCNASKVLERIIQTRLNEELENQNIIPNEQFGFRKSHSAELQALRLKLEIEKNLKEKRTTAALFIDLTKAFDKTWHSGLHQKMKQLSINPRLIKLVASFLSQRTFQVTVEGQLSDTKSIEAGVPQGSVLGPTLFNIYTSDIPKMEGVNLALYADDIVVYTSDKKPQFARNLLQQYVHILMKWTKKWRLHINPDKTKAVLFTRKTALHIADILLGRNNIPWVKEVKYLGITFDSKLLWKKHTDDNKNKGRALIKLLYPMLKSTKLNLRTKKMIYNTMIRPVITYGIIVWHDAATTHTKKIQTIQSRVLRIITSAPRYMKNQKLHEELEQDTIIKYATEMERKQIQKITQHDNNIVSNLLYHYTS